MKEEKRKIHVLGFNSYSFDDLSLNSRNLFAKINNIAAPLAYIEHIKRWSGEQDNKKVFFQAIVVFH